MTSEEWVRIRDLVDRALDHPPEERSDWIEQICQDEPNVRAEVESLLEAYQQDDSFFDEQVVARPGRGEEDEAPDRGAPPSIPSPDRAARAARPSTKPGSARI
jgi:hypothetical protein